MVYLQNRGIGYAGNSPYWWAEGGGYTINIDEAKQFTVQEARSIIRGSKGTHLWRIFGTKRVLKATFRAVDFQKLSKST